MLVLCDNCRNHYDDTSQSEECAGIGVTVANVTGAGSSHRLIATPPIVEHVAATRAARRGTA